MATSEPRRGNEVLELRSRHTCSVEEAAAFLGIGRSTAYAAARDGSLPTLRLSHRLLVPTAKLLAMVGVREGAPDSMSTPPQQKHVAGVRR
jgi:excisionase family DNA binding protein